MSAYSYTEIAKAFKNFNVIRIHAWLGKSFNIFPNKPFFKHVCTRSLLKTPWEKEKLLVTSTVFFTHLENFPPFSSKLKLLSAKSFSFEESKICHLGKGYELECQGTKENAFLKQSTVKMRLSFAFSVNYHFQ